MSSQLTEREQLIIARTELDIARRQNSQKDLIIQRQEELLALYRKTLEDLKGGTNAGV